MPCTALSSSQGADTSCRAASPPRLLTRPHFHHQITSDRLREGARAGKPPFTMNTKIRRGRRSIFKELGLDDHDCASSHPLPPSPSPNREKMPYQSDDESDSDRVADLRSEHDKAEQQEHNDGEPKEQSETDNSRLRQRHNTISSKPWFSKLANSKARPRIKSSASAPPGTGSGLQRFTMIALLVAVVLPTFSYWNGRTRVEMNGADAGPIRPRQTSPTEVCRRWAHQAALLNGTLYIYGGEAKTDSDQDQNTWNNNFLTLDLTRDWDIDSPSLTGLPVPDGPPPVALGYLWRDYNNLYLYGGQFSDSPYVDPSPESLWRYSINDEEWTEFSNPETSAGNYSEPGGQPVHRAAEGAGISVPELGLSWYFGGHLDWATTPGWSRSTDRVYLMSLLEFTHPGYVNSGVDSLSTGTGAGRGGAFRNITEGGVQAEDFPERADGVLVYIPGWGEAGILIGLAGGTNDTFVRDLEYLSVYDIKNSRWYHQQATGDIPGVRVNPCAVVATVPDGSSFQVYLFGGQNLQPYDDANPRALQEEQTQYDDMYILTIPSFTWIRVDQSGQDTPLPRAGHTCALQDSQMIVVGGYVGQEDRCDSPGIYVFDVSTLEWKSNFAAADHPADFSTGNSVLDSSYGYRVPEIVQQEIGGDDEGGATVTTPAVGEATQGPFATGQAPRFTVTATGAGPTATVTNPGPDGTEASSDGGPQPGLIAAGVIAGLAGALALYLGWCAWVYRRQVKAYKQHIAAANRYGAASNASFGAAGLFGGRRASSRRTQASGHSRWGWMGSGREPDWLSEPKWQSDEPPSSSSATATNSAGRSVNDGRPRSSGSGGSTEGLLDGQEPSFFNVVMGPRRALRVVNGIDEK
ncbi:hypothetical protein S7711_08070 [Stachybotrys chartarum IBT 7711]|uniref:Kelch repeat-containing protein n=1 Tax=Stachybotrys chartarum (strain CBS 109288 / IBT 7711) TaxID=1280523 RepID=A0A084AHL2_STACB|nr:hypothetical protein S7711_08070 [Stachybotrys chartarum IBT 7711]